MSALDVALGYDDAEAVIQASWAWPVPRKDLELYGTSVFLRLWAESSWLC